MRYLMVLLMTVFFASHAMGGQCPSLVGDIDEQLKTAQIDSAAKARIQKLRDQGESLHSQGKHNESEKVLKQALEELQAMSLSEGES